MSEDDTVNWAVRLTQYARNSIQEAWEHLSETADEVIADAWQEGIEDAIAGLARFPHRHPITAEVGLFGPPQVHHLLYRRTRTGSAYHILYRVYGPTEAPADAPFVRIIAVRHAAMAPLTEEDARSILNSEE